jgi:hypothetical protein
MNGRASPSVGSETDFERLVFGKKDPPVNDGFSWQSSITPVSSNGFNTPSTAAATPVPARARSPTPLTTAGAQKFAWSTPSPTVAPPTAPSMGSVLAPSQPNTFPAMQPASTGMATLQPSAGGFGSTSAFRSSPPPPATQTSLYNAGGIDWTAAAKPKPSFPANNSSSRPGSTQTLNQTSSLGASPAMNQMMSGLNLSGSSSTISTPGFGAIPTPAPGGATSGIKKGGGIQLTNFGTPMVPKPVTSTPPVNTFGGMNNTGSFSIGAKKPEEKQGLDAWESLI